MVVVEIKVIGHGFLDWAHRDEFNNIQNVYIRPIHYRYLLRSDEFNGLAVIMVSKIPIGKSDPALQLFIEM